MQQTSAEACCFPSPDLMTPAWSQYIHISTTEMILNPPWPLNLWPHSLRSLTLNLSVFKHTPVSHPGLTVTHVYDRMKHESALLFLTGVCFSWWAALASSAVVFSLWFSVCVYSSSNFSHYRNRFSMPGHTENLWYRYECSIYFYYIIFYFILDEVLL